MFYEFDKKKKTVVTREKEFSTKTIRPLANKLGREINLIG